MALNRELLTQAVEWIRSEAAKPTSRTTVPNAEPFWDQGTWFDQTDCGTAMCVAGWVVWQNGDRMISGSREMVDTEEGPVHVSSRAAYLLGIPYDWYDYDDEDGPLSAPLFAAGNDLLDIEYHAAVLLTEDDETANA